MKKLNREFIDYNLFIKYDKEYFCDNLIIPLYEDDIFISFGVCKESSLQTIKEKFKKLQKFYEFEKDEILFILCDLQIKTHLNELALKALNNKDYNDKFIESFFSDLISFAIVKRASDIHIEEYKKQILFRFRIDGKLRIFFSFKKEFFKLLSSYIKLVSNLDITQTRLPLNSRFTRVIENKSFDFRISTMPTISNESIVIRILDKNNVNKSIKELGLSNDLISKLKNLTNIKQGLVLITGPTGSGKTTTLYSILKELESEDKKIITIEDPVEYKIEELSQIAVNESLGLNYELVLKNILRQDPDVILIGEIRDKFSLDMALRASLTGHLVIASLHANNATETITRLLDLNDNSYLIANTLKLVLAQRLILKYCSFCNAKGCNKCNYSKYFDRTVIAELLEVDDTLSSKIHKKENIKNYLKQISFKTIFDDGKEKVDLGISSLDEVYKVVSLQ